MWYVSPRLVRQEQGADDNQNEAAPDSAAAVIEAACLCVDVAVRFHVVNFIQINALKQTVAIPDRPFLAGRR